MMAVTGMAMSVNAVSTLNWRVSNINSQTLFDQTMTANGYNKYCYRCSSFVGSGSTDTYFTHYSYYYEYNYGVYTVIVCSSPVNRYSTFSETPRDYYSYAIPPYGTEVHELFDLHQPSTAQIEKTAVGYVKTVAGNK